MDYGHHGYGLSITYGLIPSFLRLYKNVLLTTTVSQESFIVNSLFLIMRLNLCQLSCGIFERHLSAYYFFHLRINRKDHKDHAV